MYNAPGGDKNAKDKTFSIAGQTLSLKESQKEEFKARALEKLKRAYNIDGKNITLTHVVDPVFGGHQVSCSASKFSCTATATSPIKGFFLCGRDFGTVGFAGDIQGGWVTANTVLGYTAQELRAGRNIAQDLGNLK